METAKTTNKIQITFLPELAILYFCEIKKSNIQRLDLTLDGYCDFYLKADMPVISFPSINKWMSCVPS